MFQPRSGNTTSLDYIDYYYVPVGRYLILPLCSTKLSLVKVMYFPPRDCYKAYDTFLSFFVCRFAQILLKVSGHMELVTEKKVVMVGYRWRVYTVFGDWFKFDIWFWCFWWMNCCILDKVKCIFECFVCWPYVAVCWQGIGIWRDAVLFYGWYFRVKGVNVFHTIRFDVINFIFNCCLRIGFFCFDFAADSVVDIHLFNMIFKGRGNLEICFFCSKRF